MMPAKKPAPKAAKGQKAASRPPARKPVVARKPAERVKAAAAAHVRKSADAPRETARDLAKETAKDVAGEGLRDMAKDAARDTVAETPKKAPPHRSSTLTTEETIEMRKALEPAPETPLSSAPSASDQTVVPPRASQVLAAADTDDNDSVEPGSLLAGPRNVQPYIVKRGELYMSKEQLEHFRQILLSWKQDLMVEVDRTVSHMKDEAANFPDPNDRATQEEEFSLELRTRDRERKLIRKIDEALKRIEDGSYGYCLETGEEIGIKRLEARPVATLSIEAQERRERRERQYGDRDDRYR
jgi:DnaK suppressor protein